jgi:hypothetical protein
MALDPPDDAATAAPDPGLAALGLVAGDRVRWRDRPGARWRTGRVEARERDGSVAVRDERGASRALRHERLEVAARGPRGAATWEPVAARAGRTEQLGLWDRAPSGPPARPR